MKKIFGIALTLILSICLVCVIAVSASPSPMEVKLSETSGIAGSTVTVDVSLSDNTGFGTLAFYVYFDTSKLTLVSVQRNITVPEGYVDAFLPSGVSTANNVGRYYCGWTAQEGSEGVFAPNITQNGNVATFQFTIADNVAVGTVIPVTFELDSCYLNDLYNTDVDCTLVNGSVTVIACDHVGNTNELTETKTPNCTEEGEKTATCSVCGADLSEPISVVEDAHEWGQYTETTPGNCTTPAVLTRVCAHNANHKETKDGEIVADSHDYSDWSEVTPGNCTTPSVEKRVCSRDASHFETRDGEIVADNHAWGDWSETTPGNCTTPAVLTRVCAHNASHKETKDGEIVADSHDYSDWTEVTPGNCTTPSVEKRVCSRDASHFETRDGAIVSDDHDWGDWSETTPGNCTTPAVLTRVCAHNANHKETKDGEIVADSHDYSDWTEVTPGNCTTPSVEKRVCAHNANHYETRNGTIVADNHAYGEWSETAAGSCTNPGEESRVCANDPNHIETRTTTVNPDNHDFGEWNVTTPPTADTEGERTRVCAHNPNHVETQTLAKLNSTFTSEDGSASITLDDTSLVPTDAKLEIEDFLELVDDGDLADIQAIVKEKTGKELADYYGYCLLEGDNAAIIDKGTVTITVPVNEGFENLKYYVISLDDSGFIDVTDKIVEGKLTYDVEEYGVVMLISAGDKVVVNEGGQGTVTPENPDKNPQNGDNAAIPFILVATMLSAAAVMVIFKKKVNA